MNHYRDKGYRVGFISGLRGEKSEIRSVGVTFPDTPVNRSRGKRWYRLLMIDLWLVFVGGAMIGMLLPTIFEALVRNFTDSMHAVSPKLRQRIEGDPRQTAPAVALRHPRAERRVLRERRLRVGRRRGTRPVLTVQRRMLGVMSTGEAPVLPGALWFARLVFVSIGVLLLVALAFGFLAPDQEAGASGESGSGVAGPLVWLGPVAMLVLGLQLRAGGIAIRVALALVVVFLVSGSVAIAAQDFVFGGLGGGGVGLVATLVGLVAMPLLYLAVVLMFLPSSNTYAREVRRLRFAAPPGPPAQPQPE